jgi:hypothetical protein
VTISATVRRKVNFVKKMARRPSTRHQARHHTHAHVVYHQQVRLWSGSFCLISMLTHVS